MTWLAYRQYSRAYRGPSVADAVHTHSLRWVWLLSVPKSVVMVVGKQSVCARLGAPELSWGACRLPISETVKYLGLRLESEA